MIILNIDNWVNATNKQWFDNVYKEEDFGTFRERHGFLFFPKDAENASGQSELRWLCNATWFEQLQNDMMGWTGWETIFWDKLPQKCQINDSSQKINDEKPRCKYCGTKVKKINSTECKSCGAPL